MLISFGASEFFSGATAQELTRSSTDLLDSHSIIPDLQKINSCKKQSNYWAGGPLPKVSDLLIAMDNGKPVQQMLPHPSKSNANPKEFPEENFTGQYCNTT